MINGRINDKIQTNVRSGLLHAQKRQELMEKRKVMNRFQTEKQLPGLKPPDIRVYEDPVMNHYKVQRRKGNEVIRYIKQSLKEINSIE